MAKMKTVVGYEMVFVFKDGSLLKVRCEDWDSVDGKVCLSNVKMPEGDYDFEFVMESGLHSYMGNNIYKED